MTTIQIELWALVVFLVGLLLSFFGAAFTAGRILLAQVKRSLDERFVSIEKAREEGKAHWDERFGRLESAVTDSAAHTTDVERQLLRLQAELPLHYVRREDYIRGQSVLEAKLDGMAVRIENAVLRNGGNL